jgi:hypothetical protein
MVKGERVGGVAASLHHTQASIFTACTHVAVRENKKKSQRCC